MQRLQEAATALERPLAQVIRDAMQIGLADWKLTGFKTDALIARAAIEMRSSQNQDDVALIAETGSGYQTSVTPSAKKSAAGPIGRIVDDKLAPAPAGKSKAVSPAPLSKKHRRHA